MQPPTHSCSLSNLSIVRPCCRLTCPEPYFVSEGLYATADELVNTREVTLHVMTIGGFIEDPGKVSHPSTVTQTVSFRRAAIGARVKSLTANAASAPRTATRARPFYSFLTVTKSNATPGITTDASRCKEILKSRRRIAGSTGTPGIWATCDTNDAVVLIGLYCQVR